MGPHEVLRYMHGNLCAPCMVGTFYKLLSKKLDIGMKRINLYKCPKWLWQVSARSVTDALWVHVPVTTITVICTKNRKTIKENESTNYTRIETIENELNNSKKTFQKYQWPIIDVTRKSVEETAASVIKIHEIYSNKKWNNLSF